MLKRQLEHKEQMAGADAYPSPPKMAEAVELTDRRPIIAAGTVAGIALIFSLLFFMISTRGSAPDPYAIPFAAHSGEIEPLTGIGLRHPEVAGMLSDDNGQEEASADNHRESAIV